MMKFEFEVDAEAQDFCCLIVSELVRNFGIDSSEALGRLNRAWRGISIVGDDIVYHEDEEFWAFNIYYGHDSFWWQNPPELKPLPYP